MYYAGTCITRIHVLRENMYFPIGIPVSHPWTNWFTIESKTEEKTSVWNLGECWLTEWVGILPLCFQVTICTLRARLPVRPVILLFFSHRCSLVVNRTASPSGTICTAQIWVSQISIQDQLSIYKAINSAYTKLSTQHIQSYQLSYLM